MEIQEFFSTFDWFMGVLGGIALAIGFANFTKAVVGYRARYTRRYTDQQMVDLMALGGASHLKRKLTKDITSSLMLTSWGACIVLMAIYANPLVPLEDNRAFGMPLLILIVQLCIGGLITLMVAVDPIFGLPFKDIRAGVLTAFSMMCSGLILMVMTAVPMAS